MPTAEIAEPLQAGFYEALQVGAGEIEQQQQQQAQQQGREGGERQMEAQQPMSPRAPLLPDHLRLVVTPDLAACLTRGASSRGSSPSRAGGGGSGTSTPASSPSRAGSSGSSGGSMYSGTSADSLRDLTMVGGGGSPVLPASPEGSSLGFTAAPLEWAAAFAQARRAARAGHWTKSGAAHEGEAADWEQEQELEQEPGDGSGSGSSGSGSSSPEPGATPVKPPRWRKAVAWSILAGSESDEEAEARRRGSWWGGGRAAAGSGRGQLPAAVADEAAQQQAAGGEGQQQPYEVIDAEAAWQRFMECSGASRWWCAAPAWSLADALACLHMSLLLPLRPHICPPPPFSSMSAVVCGMHPDGATEFIVDLALALDKPFAVVPCCVFGREFPRWVEV
jgi:hypothetical protein